LGPPGSFVCHAISSFAVAFAGIGLANVMRATV
jgi:hypothetical protein